MIFFNNKKINSVTNNLNINGDNEIGNINDNKIKII